MQRGHFIDLPVLLSFTLAGLYSIIISGIHLIIKGVFRSVKIIARHLTADMYNCKNSNLGNNELLSLTLKELLSLSSFNILKMDSHDMGDGHFAIIILLQEGHLTIHTYHKLKYTATDIFLCNQEGEPEKLFRSLRDFFKPEKTKTTYLKRGDFGTVKDMKPKIKTKVAPLRRIHNTGAKVIRLLAHKSKTNN